MTNSNTLLTRRVDKVLPSKEALEKLMGKRKIKLYQGFDPTGTRLHLGHSIGLRKLMEFANAGHEVIFLFGTGTVLAGGGDPSDRDTGRKMITQEEIDANIKDWKKQVSPLVDWSKITIKQNGDWLIPLTLKEILEIANNISAIQLFKREMFQRRLQHGDTVWLSETLYPLLQGYDSVAMDVDLEIGGTDQEFNMLVGRELMKKMKNKEKFVLTTPMILGTDGKQMSKSSGNCVWLDDTAGEMYGKIMSLPDEQIESYFENLTNLSIKDIPTHPMEAKKMLAKDIVRQFHGEKEAEEAQKEFEEVFSRGGTPENTPTYSVKSPTIDIIEALTGSHLVTSRSEARRLLDQGGLEWNGEKLETAELEVGEGGTLKVGKHRFLKIEKG
ncbi:MAG: tyrosine--tRNA ligase [Candidatus Blackburnbacteria bacterium RIFCSPHIGHO2_01_FULL_44_64]|uniref:Tyrosine--tRNA ligase n=1 Tax=Candidatus Blackburnbacteria bacterium RIFCSPHIGHO2_02_FULL_44_20 TaxID=1797516 RepID=A0A1G1V7J9_9BACT|nr:MAG: tyrosine--tRNA ligase [Candidatus Blackburnbacteria bacterium RIFCSPHIGHO2_01_FULL_44_64]OGY10205.1 MAG: tyrosine--tRNA ligase [Candidatus Blackburnbacteria bacterium RIFCSPHIGHO2_12_FULL_44_25]OGY11346.1 MAG: tyrosine--tRNA ligase [Candidatus Blackburnbacteria bacterium RIFCSPHIGHO2_02_FULL_44_20]OGY13522.1 MAG: tyrosine--tRNA ligase [Candidatus Blackburnbacteria bacterium RIFCSPLOWO2_01_FULL_44_43]OGY15340.1 MAG: tyrosine--tRNA ligase [Candidatus Blackburnbacteria bacterium RIFCSPLOWO